MRPKLINLDDPSNERSLIVLRVGEQFVKLTRERIEQLLAVEDSWLSSELSRVSRPDTPAPFLAPMVPAPAPAEQPSKAKAKLPSTGGVKLESINHASLSYRIKRIYAQTCLHQTLRETHKGLLLEMIERFDGILPDHPNTQLDQHLREMLTMISPDDQNARTRIERFLERYALMRAG